MFIYLFSSYFKIPMGILPKIHSSAEIYGNITTASALSGVPISAILGDQQAGLIGLKAGTGRIIVHILPKFFKTFASKVFFRNQQSAHMERALL